MLIVYFSSVSNNTHRFVMRLGEATPGLDMERIQLRRKDEPLSVNRPYLLITPTYGHGTLKGAVPKQVIQFLNDEQNRGLCQAVVSAGNTNFGSAFCIAGDIISARLERNLGREVPHVHKFELLGTPYDIDKVGEILTEMKHDLTQGALTP